MSLINCPECKREISDQAEACPGCGTPIVAKKGQSTGVSAGRVFLVLLLVLGVLYYFGNHLAPRVPNGTTATTPTNAVGSRNTGPILRLDAMTCEKEHGYAYVRGEVKNISEVELQNVLAVGEFRTKGGAKLVKSDSSLTEYNPIMPGQSSPFRVGTTDNPLIQTCQVFFTTFSGARIETLEAYR